MATTQTDSGNSNSRPKLIEIARTFVEQHFPRRRQCIMCGQATYEWHCPSCGFLTRDNPNVLFDGEVTSG